MSTPVLAGTDVRTGPGTARPYLPGALAALPAGAAAIHFAMALGHFGVFCDDLSASATSSAVHAALAAPAR
jgi:hypothetical protein